MRAMDQKTGLIQRLIDWIPLWVVILMLGGIATADRLLPPPLDRAYDLSPTLTDAEGRLLRASTSAKGFWRLDTDAEAVDSRYLTTLLAFEDRRFHGHDGVDYYGMARAVITSAQAGRLISGGSTLSMQTARLLEPRPRRTVGAKVMEILRAWQLERRFTKEEILNLYLNTAPFGGNIEGAGAAAWRYFGKRPAELTWAESALLVALPQSPARRRPDRFPERAEAARNRVLDVLERRALISAAQNQRAKREPVPSTRRAMPFLAPAVADRLWQEAPDRPGSSTHETTLHHATQTLLESLLQSHLAAFPAPINGAALLVEAETGRIVARVGSAGYLQTRAGARLDLTRAQRSPGSALKPAIFALAFDAGLAHPGTWLPDDRRNFAGYQPENFSTTRQGSVRAFAALQQSLNPPATALLNRYGAERALEALDRAAVLPDHHAAPGETGLSLVLGGVSLRMEDLVQLYAAFATDGRVRRLCETPAACAEPGRTRAFVSASAAEQITAILSETDRPHGFRHEDAPRLAFKTGTSARHRDAWAVGYDGKHVLAVWLGRPDNRPTNDLVGLTDVAPLLFRVFSALDERVPLRVPAGSLEDTVRDTPLALRRLDGLTPPAADPFRLTFPTDGSALPLPAGRAVALKLSGGERPFRLFVDGMPRARAVGRQITWTPESAGFFDLTILDRSGQSVTASVEITGALSGE